MSLTSVHAGTAAVPLSLLSQELSEGQLSEDDEDELEDEDEEELEEDELPQPAHAAAGL